MVDRYKDYIDRANEAIYSFKTSLCDTDGTEAPREKFDGFTVGFYTCLPDEADRLADVISSADGAIPVLMYNEKNAELAAKLSDNGLKTLCVDGCGLQAVFASFDITLPVNMTPGLKDRFRLSGECAFHESPMADPYSVKQSYDLTYAAMDKPESPDWYTIFGLGKGSVGSGHDLFTKTLATVLPADEAEKLWNDDLVLEDKFRANLQLMYKYHSYLDYNKKLIQNIAIYFKELHNSMEGRSRQAPIKF